jgi:tRNA dimethylallyltransferase
LSIDLAKALKGQVINGDALQVYRTANILTNKVTPQEMDGVKHHLMDFYPPTEQYDVYRFKKEAIQIVPPPNRQCWC